MSAQKATPTIVLGTLLRMTARMGRTPAMTALAGELGIGRAVCHKYVQQLREAGILNLHDTQISFVPTAWDDVARIILLLRQPDDVARQLMDRHGYGA